MQGLLSGLRALERAGPPALSPGAHWRAAPSWPSACPCTAGPWDGSADTCSFPAWGQWLHQLCRSSRAGPRGLVGGLWAEGRGAPQFWALSPSLAVGPWQIPYLPRAPVPSSVAGNSVSYCRRGVRAAGRCVASLPPRVCSRHVCVISYIKLKQPQVTAASGGQEGRQEDGDGQPELRWSLRTTPPSGPRGRGRSPRPMLSWAAGGAPSGCVCAWLSLLLPTPSPVLQALAHFPASLG